MTSRPICRTRSARSAAVRVAIVLGCLAFIACDQGLTPSVTPPAESPPATAASASHPVASPSFASPSVSPSASASTPPAPSESPGASLATPPPEPADAERVRVVESGFTAFADGSDFASFAAVLENPNARWAAMRMLVMVDFLDADGAFVAGEELFVQILPGQRTAIAGEAFGAGQARQMTVNVPEDTTAFEDSAASEASFAIMGVDTTRADGLNRTEGRVRSRFPDTQSSVLLAAVYRDGRGRILGGAVGGLDSIAPGETQEFEIIDSAPFRNLARTEVFWQVSGLRQ